MMDYSKLMDALKNALIAELSEDEEDIAKYAEVLCSTDPWEFNQELQKVEGDSFHLLTVVWKSLAKDELLRA